MDYKRLLAVDIFDSETEANYAFYTGLTYTTPLHCHDFYELFLITRGAAVHCVNGSEQHLSKGALVFVRPDDLHAYQKHGDTDCQFANVAFPCSTLAALFDYLGDGFPSQPLITAQLSPCVHLSESDTTSLERRLARLNTLPQSQKSLIRAELRAMLLVILTHYFTAEYVPDDPDIPVWFQQLCATMQDQANFADGLEAMKRLTGRSHEHICRSFRRYRETTPTEFVAGLRLNYAAGLLANSDLTIIDLAAEAGFNNLSHFYHLFRKRYAMSPTEYRRIHQRNLAFPRFLNQAHH